MKPEDYFKPGSVAFVQAQEAINTINAAKAAGLPEAEQYEKSFMASLDLVKKNRNWSGFDANRQAIASLAPQIQSITQNKAKQDERSKRIGEVLATSKELGTEINPETLTRLNQATETGDFVTADLIAQRIQDLNKTTQELNIKKSEEEMKASMASSEKPKKTVGDISFEQNATAALRYAGELEDAIKQYGTYEAYNTSGSAKLAQLPYQMAIAYAKTVDPTSVAREGEVDAAKKYLIPMGMGTRNETALAAAREFKRDIEQRIEQYNKSTGANIEIPKESLVPSVNADQVKALNKFYNENR